MTGKERIEILKTEHPDVHISVTRELDEYFQWDGDGPDPELDGYEAYNVDVEAMTIRNGELITGSDSLGGSYFKPDEEIGECHGYLPQMIDEALERLDEALKERGL